MGDEGRAGWSLSRGTRLVLAGAVCFTGVAGFVLLRPKLAANTPAPAAATAAAASTTDVPQGPLAATAVLAAPRGLAGAWKYDSGKLVTTCEGVSTEKDAAGSTFVLEAAGSADSFLYRKGGCAIPLKTSSSGLSAAPSAACTEGSVTVSYDHMELNGTEAGADVVATGTMRSSLGTRHINCDFKASGRAHR
jgi:hypothetical protein